MDEENLEERKKVIEKFSINRNPTEFSSNESNLEYTSFPDKNIVFQDEIQVGPDIYDNKIDDFEDSINSKGLLFAEDAEIEKKMRKKKKQNTIIVLVLFILALSHLTYKYISVITKEVPVYKEYALLEQMKTQGVSENKTVSVGVKENKDSVKNVDDVKENVREKQSQIAILEDQKATLKRSIENLSDSTKSVPAIVKKSSKVNVNSSDTISKIWRIVEVKNSGQSIVLQMVGYDRYITISIGDTIMDAGLIRSIRKENGKWIVVGLKKRVE